MAGALLDARTEDGDAEDRRLAARRAGARWRCVRRAATAARGEARLDGRAALARWLAGPLGDRLATIVSRDRLAAQEIWRPEAVTEAFRRARAETGGWTAEHALLLATTVVWIERHGVARDVR
jgi:hypothetical protein